MSHIVPRANSGAFLTRFGGKSPFEQPQWRLLVGSDRLVKGKPASIGRPGRWPDDSGEGRDQFHAVNPDAPGMNMSRYENKPIRGGGNRSGGGAEVSACRRLDSGEVVSRVRLWNEGKSGTRIRPH